MVQYWKVYCPALNAYEIQTGDSKPTTCIDGSPAHAGLTVLDREEISSVFSSGNILLKSSSTSNPAIDITASAVGGLINLDAGTGGITIDSVGSISLDCTGITTSCNFSHTGSAGNDLTVQCSAGSLVLSSGEAATDAVSIVASNATGGVTITSGLGNVTIGGTGSLVLSSVATQTLTGNAETIDTTLLINKVTAGAARTGIILEAGSSDGQLFILLKIDALANSITFNSVTTTSNVAGTDVATQDALSAIGTYFFIWNSTNSLWYPSPAASLS